MLPVKVTSGGTPDFIPRSDNSSKLKASCWISLRDEACLLPKILNNYIRYYSFSIIKLISVIMKMNFNMYQNKLKKNMDRL